MGENPGVGPARSALSLNIFQDLRLTSILPLNHKADALRNAQSAELYGRLQALECGDLSPLLFGLPRLARTAIDARHTIRIEGSDKSEHRMKVGNVVILAVVDGIHRAALAGNSVLLRRMR